MTTSLHGRRQSRTAGSLARELAAALTPDEIHEVLAASLLALSVPERKKVLDAVGKGTAESVRRILEGPSPRRGSERVTPSPARLEMEWTAAWEGWEGCVSDAADEHGPFVVHDPPWESPWFDSTAFSAALDATVDPIRKLWPRAVAAELVEDIDVAEALVEATREIASAMPEWMSPPPTEDLTFGEPVTALLLDALDVTNRCEGRDAYALIVAIRAVEDSLDPAGLDANAVMRFIDRLAPQDRAVVQKGIADARTTPMWKRDLEMPRSHWFRSFQALNAKLAPELGLDLSRQNVASDWRLAGPVLDALRKRREHQEIIELAARAVYSLLRLRDGETWAPTRSLLAALPETGWTLAAPSDRSAAKRILNRWRDAEEATGRAENAAALALQSVVLARPLDWESVLDAFAKHAQVLARTGDDLFGQWRELIVKESAVGEEDEEADGPTWVAMLVDAARRGPSAGVAFRQGLTGWLDSCVASSASADRLRAALGVLTLDLDALRCLGPEHPRLIRFVKQFEARSADVAKSRREWLGRLGASQLGPNVLSCWQRLAVLLAPDPGRSDYGDCADWLAIVLELDADGGARLLHQWSERHARRRNLWAELGKRGIAPPASSGARDGRPPKRESARRD